MSDAFVFTEQRDEFDWKEIMKGDPGEGVPSGGTTGQYLRKKSNADYDTEWGSLEVATVSETRSYLGIT